MHPFAQHFPVCHLSFTNVSCCGITTTDAASGSCHQNGQKWQRAVAHHRPFQVWDHAHGLTEYQVWTCYRIATMQLNIYHENRNDDNSCRAHQACRGVQETQAHIFWDCPKARSCWAKLIGHWTGETTADLFSTCQYLGSANRQAPAVTG